MPNTKSDSTFDFFNIWIDHGNNISIKINETFQENFCPRSIKLNQFYYSNMNRPGLLG